MILDAAWAPTPDCVFATAGRDKEVKIWGVDEKEGDCGLKASVKEEYAVTAIDFTTVPFGDGKVRVPTLLRLCERRKEVC